MSALPAYLDRPDVPAVGLVRVRAGEPAGERRDACARYSRCLREFVRVYGDADGRCAEGRGEGCAAFERAKN